MKWTRGRESALLYFSQVSGFFSLWSQDGCTCECAICCQKSAVRCWAFATCHLEQLRYSLHTVVCHAKLLESFGKWKYWHPMVQCPHFREARFACATSSCDDKVLTTRVAVKGWSVYDYPKILYILVYRNSRCKSIEEIGLIGRTTSLECISSQYKILAVVPFNTDGWAVFFCAVHYPVWRL